MFTKNKILLSWKCFFVSLCLRNRLLYFLQKERRFLVYTGERVRQRRFFFISFSQFIRVSLRNHFLWINIFFRISSFLDFNGDISSFYACSQSCFFFRQKRRFRLFLMDTIESFFYYCLLMSRTFTNETSFKIIEFFWLTLPNRLFERIITNKFEQNLCK